MGKDVKVGAGGGRTRRGVMAAIAAVIVAAAFVPLAAGHGRDHGHHNHHGHHGSSRGDGKLLFFASDGMRQDQIAKYADQGLLPGLPRHAAPRRLRVQATAC